jgi:predicted nuclease with TOPRIM domain
LRKFQSLATSRADIVSSPKFEPTIPKYLTFDEFCDGKQDFKDTVNDIAWVNSEKDAWITALNDINNDNSHKNELLNKKVEDEVEFLSSQLHEFELLEEQQAVMQSLYELEEEKKKTPIQIQNLEDDFFQFEDGIISSEESDFSDSSSE